MKQTITLSQYQELPEEPREVIRQWAQERGYDFLLTIGAMVELLMDMRAGLAGVDVFAEGWSVRCNVPDNPLHIELVDALWECVKQVLQPQ